MISNFFSSIYLISADPLKECVLVAYSPESKLMSQVGLRIHKMI